MRLFLLPVSTRRTLIYCQRIARNSVNARPSLLDRATTKANEIWADFEKSEVIWKKRITQYGNVILRRIPFEEWGLKTIPSLSARRHQAELSGKEKVEVLFPGLFLRPSRADAELKKLATERQDLHRKRMWWSIIAFPFTLPIALLPMYVRDIEHGLSNIELRNLEFQICLAFTSCSELILIGRVWQSWKCIEQ